jgi:hypothetical protein
MKRSTWGKVFLLLVLILAWMAQWGSAAAENGCAGTSAETCADDGCAATPPAGHFGCQWSASVKHCLCNLLSEEG